jgi:proton glutamate symport protein
MIKNIFKKSQESNQNEIDPNDLTYGVPPVEENTKEYPRFAVKIKESILFVWNRLLWGPFMTVWRFFAARTNLTVWIIVGMVVGILIGHFAPEAGAELKPLGTAFIRMITIIETPLIFSTLVVGIAGHGDDVGKVGRLAVKTIIVSVL